MNWLNILEKQQQKMKVKLHRQSVLPKDRSFTASAGT